MNLYKKVMKAISPKEYAKEKWVSYSYARKLLPVDPKTNERTLKKVIKEVQEYMNKNP